MHVTFFSFCNCYLLKGHKPFLKSLVLFFFFSWPTNCHFFPEAWYQALALLVTEYSWSGSILNERGMEGGGDCGYQHQQMGSPCIHCKETETPFRNRRQGQSQGSWQGQEKKERELWALQSHISMPVHGCVALWKWECVILFC